jgi:hypothetical protein
MIQIVPVLPPSISGVGDYALALAREMRSGFGIETLFLVTNEQWDGPEQVEGFSARRLTGRSAEHLCGLLGTVREIRERASVLLQLSGYGYSRRGCPFWLLEGLRHWKRQQPAAHLVTMFHELYATAPPWRTTFWVSPAQRMVVAGIARESDIAITNIQKYRTQLERLDPSRRKRIETLAVPSNVGEPCAPQELSARSRSMVVFGLPQSRQRAYRMRMSELQMACERLEIEQVHDVGASFDDIPVRIGRVPVKRHGRLSAGDLSLLLAQSMAGFVDYFPGYMAKSGIFAAYCAHRMLVVAPRDGRSEADGLLSGIHYCNVQGKAAGDMSPQRIADAAWGWYQGHSMQNHARAFAAAVRN